ncbi:MAG TPA: acyl carrier protein [Phycisphaerae bacterium]|nr:acyl carrier protein [Phycisphaerae bacterium]
MHVRDEITCFLVDVLGVPNPDGPIATDAPLVDQLGVDSAGVFELILWVEDRWGIRIPPEDMILANFETIEAIESYLGRRWAPSAEDDTQGDGR